ncbi:hypothetical protein OIU76_027063 [Salix suchowensis]|nr:hypothetical protein OIU76_027063 [Salix suchowensis]
MIVTTSEAKLLSCPHNASYHIASFGELSLLTFFSYFFEFPMSSNVNFFPCGLVSSRLKKA